MFLCPRHTQTSSRTNGPPIHQPPQFPPTLHTLRHEAQNDRNLVHSPSWAQTKAYAEAAEAASKKLRRVKDEAEAAAKAATEAASKEPRRVKDEAEAAAKAATENPSCQHGWERVGHSRDSPLSQAQPRLTLTT